MLLRLAWGAPICLLVSSQLLLAGPVRIEAFDWPDDAATTLGIGLHHSVPNHYTVEQADDFLANALVRLSHLARDDFPHIQVAGSDRLISATFLPRHNLATQGIDYETAGPQRATLRWFSLPLLTQPPASKQDLTRVPTLLADGRLTSSLDLIRFDRFAPRTESGFWLPTAIVRPKVVPAKDGRISGRVQFEVLYEYPTSPIRYRNVFRTDPTQAPSYLANVLQQKESVWLGKLSEHDRSLISMMWQRSLESPLLPASPFFTPAERQAWRAAHGRTHFKALQRLQDVPAGTSAGPSQPAGLSFSDADEQVRSPHGVNFPSSPTPSWQRHKDGSSTSTKSILPPERPILEHSFFDIDSTNERDEPLPHQARQTWHDGPDDLHQPISIHGESSFTHTQNSDGDLNLDLTLAPPSSRSQNEE